MKEVFNHVKDVMGFVTEVLLLLACMAILGEVVFGTEWLGNISVVDNVMGIVTRLGNGGFVGLLSLLVIVMMYKRK